MKDKKMRCFLIEYLLRLRRWTDQTARLADLVRGFVSTPLERGRKQCCGPVTFWYGCGSGSSDPYLCLTDPFTDPYADPGDPKHTYPTDSEHW
jgi:hypothetical protein